MANNNNAAPNPDYQPTTWEQGMIITAKDLNDMEEQIDELVEAVPEIIKVSDSTPNNPYNQVWIKKGEPITLAQMDDFNTFCDSFAPTYTKGNNYEIGDYVIYNTILYKCKQKVTNAPKQLKQSAWSKVYLIDDITNLIKVQDTQPTSQLNKLWLTSTPDQGVTLATYQDFINMIAEEYSTTKLYKTGDYVIHDGHLYRRLNDASNPGNWTQNNWTAVTIGEEIRDMSIASNNTMASIATEYDPAKTYNVGDYCKYNSKIYRCNTSIGTAEAWTARHWAEVMLGEELNNLESALMATTGKNVSWEIDMTGYGQRYDSGSLINNETWCITKYTDVSTFKYLHYAAVTSTANTTYFGIAFFTGKTAGQYISGIQAYDHSTVIGYKEQWAKVPDNAVYARFTVVATDIENFFIEGYKNIHDTSESIENKISNVSRQYLKNKFLSGGITDKGAINTNTARIRNDASTAPKIEKGDAIIFSGPYEGRICSYSSQTFNTSTFIRRLDYDFQHGYIPIPEEAVGTYCGILVRKIKATSEDISADVAEIEKYVKYYRAACGPLTGKKLSVMGDSISSMQGYIPDGYDYYYSGSNHGVTSVNQMWWKILADKLGMKVCVINGYSGSAVTQLEDSSHINKIPMSSDERTSGLGTETETPDIIIIAGGTNDYSYARSAQSEPLEWDGKTAPVLTNSFTEAYACMVKKIQTNYPNAIVIACSTWFTLRGEDNGYTLTHTSNGHIYTQADYDRAIENVCKQMRIPYICVNNIGFNRNNFYPTYAPDSATVPTHTNAAGQRIMGLAVAEKILPIVAGYEGY